MSWHPNRAVPSSKPMYLGVSKMIRVFVYGTLMKGGYYHKQFLSGQKYLGKGIISDYALYDLGHYPGIVPEKGEQVKGEVYGVDWRTLHKIDDLEDKGSLYNRKRVKVMLEDGKFTRAYIYVWNGPVSPENKVDFDRQPWREKDS